MVFDATEPVYFWSLKNAIDFAEGKWGKSVVWRRDGRRAYVKGNEFPHVHEDAKNFFTNY